MHDLARAAIPLCLVAVGCATARRASPAPSAATGPVPLAASSMPSSYGIQLRLQGSVAVQDGWVYVVVPTGVVRTYQGTTPTWDLMLRAGLATCRGRDEWDVVSESRAARVARVLGFTRDSSVLDTTGRAFRDTLRLDLGVPRGTDLARTWVTFELAWPIGDELATYTLHSGAVLAPSGGWDARRPADGTCR